MRLRLLHSGLATVLLGPEAPMLAIPKREAKGWLMDATLACLHAKPFIN